MMSPSAYWVFATLVVRLTSSSALLGGETCGWSTLGSTSRRYLRIVGGSQALYGSHPWLMSLRFRGAHFCGAAILTERWLLTAAHCFTAPTEEFLRGVEAVVGEYDRRVVDRGEQRFGVKNAMLHEQYHPRLPMNYDVAMLELKGRIHFGDFAQPVCLPLPGETFPPRTPCIVAGWGQTKERGQMASVLHEVHLDLVDPSICESVLQTLRPGLRNLTVLCAGRERGGKDACQGDSGGPLLCPRADGQMVVVGITSWGKGCGRSWIKNKMRPRLQRSSPAVFTDIPVFVKWLLQKENVVSRLCVRDETLKGSERVIQYPLHPDLNYSNNEACSWSISAPEGKRILMEFLKFDLENHPQCQSDHLTVFAGESLPIGRFCGSDPPPPLLIHANTAELQFMSDFRVSGSGFSIRITPVRDDYTLGPSCGTVALFQSPAVLQSPGYPRSYGDDAHCRWVIYVPEGHVVKLDFTDFILEDSDECQYDSLSVFGDSEAREQIGKPTKAALPETGVVWWDHSSPVLSFDRVMVVQFGTDASVSAPGFSANLSVISKNDLYNGEHDDLNEEEHHGEEILLL